MVTVVSAEVITSWIKLGDAIGRVVQFISSLAGLTKNGSIEIIDKATSKLKDMVAITAKNVAIQATNVYVNGKNVVNGGGGGGLGDSVKNVVKSLVQGASIYAGAKGAQTLLLGPGAQAAQKLLPGVVKGGVIGKIGSIVGKLFPPALIASGIGGLAYLNASTDDIKVKLGEFAGRHSLSGTQEEQLEKLSEIYDRYLREKNDYEKFEPDKNNFINQSLIRITGAETAYRASEAEYEAAAKKFAEANNMSLDEVCALVEQYRNAKTAVEQTTEEKKEQLEVDKQIADTQEQIVEAQEQTSESTIPDLETTFDELKTQILDLLNNSGSSDTTSFLSSLSDYAEEAGINIDELNSKLAEAMSGVALTDEQIEQIDGNFSDILKLSTVLDSGQKAELAANLGFDLFDVFEYGGLGAIKGLLSTSDDMKDAAKSFWNNDLIDPIMETGEMHSPSKATERLGVYAGQGFIKGFQFTQKSLMNITSGIIHRFLDNFKALPNYMKLNGVSTVNGLINGLNGGIQSSYNMGAKLADAVNRGYRDKLKIHSPSRVFEELSTYIPQGIALGIEGSTWYAIDAIGMLAQGMEDATERAMARAAYVASDSYSIEPKIRPVIDASAITGTRNSINSLFSSNSIDSALREINKASRASLDNATIVYNNQNRDVVEAIQQLDYKIGQLGKTMQDMQLVMDTGVVVGALTPAINAELGKTAVRERRQ
jgi:hypothetical protein